MAPVQGFSTSEKEPFGVEQQLIHLLSLLGEHGTRLSHAHRAQHLQGVRSLFKSLQADSYGRLSNFILLALSRFLVACEKENGGIKDDVLEALFGVVICACACQSGDQIYELARDSGAILPDAFAAVGGLFTSNEKVDTVEGSVLPDTFIVSRFKFNAARKAFRQPQQPHTRASVAHIVLVACETCITNDVLRLRVAALGSLAALVRVLHPSQLAAFFPGIASKLSKVLARSRLDQTVLSVLAIDTLSVAVAAVFPKTKIQSSDVSFASLVHSIRENKRSQNDANRDEEDEEYAKNREKKGEVGLVERTDAWYSASSKNFSRLLKVILESADGPRWHDNERVRGALGNLVSTCVLRRSKLQLELVVRAECFITIVEIASDPYDDPQKIAMDLVSESLNTSDGCAPDIESGLQSIISYVLRLNEASSFGFEMVDEIEDTPENEALQQMLNVHDDEPRWTRVLEGYLRVLNGSYGTEVLLRIGSDELARVVVTFQKAINKLCSINSPDQYELLRNAATDSCWRLGKAGMLPALQGALISIAQAQPDNVNNEEIVHHDQPDAFVNHTHVVQCMNAMLSGAADRFRRKYIDMRTTDEYVDWIILKRHVIETLECATACSLPLDEEVYRRGEWALASTLRAKQAVLICCAQSLDTLAKLKNKHRPAGFELIMPTILPFLVDAAREESEVSDAAEHALSSLVKAVGYKDTRELVKRHVNFVVARLVRNLHRKWAAAVLRYVVGQNHDELCVRVVELSSDTLIAQCDALAGASDDRANTTLAAIGAILSTALSSGSTVKQTPRTTHRKRTNREQWEMEELMKVLMSYCTEDVREGDDFLPSDDEWPHLSEDNGEKEEREKSPLEQIAVSVLSAIVDLLVGRPAELRANALRVAAIGIDVLVVDERALLPCVAALLPLIPEQLGEQTSASSDDRNIVGIVNERGRELPVVAATCALTTALVRAARGFVQARFVRLIYPRLRPFLQLVRVGAHADASFAALAVADSALECVSVVATELPDALLPFAKELTNVAIPYLGREKETRAKAARAAGNEARRRYELRRFERRARWADALLSGLAETAPDEVWALLVVESAPDDVIVHGDEKMMNLRVR